MMRRLKAPLAEPAPLIYVDRHPRVWHYWWQVKKTSAEPLLYALNLAALLGWRLWRASARLHRSSALPRAPEKQPEAQRLAR